MARKKQSILLFPIGILVFFVGWVLYILGSNNSKRKTRSQTVKKELKGLEFELMRLEEPINNE